jgi:hypothetical protein
MNLPSRTELDFARRIMEEHNVRPLGALLFRHVDYLSDGLTFKVYLTATKIGIDKEGNFPVFSVDYVGLSIQDVAAQLSNSPYPVEVVALANVTSLAEGELMASAARIPDAFHHLDRWSDGKSAIVRCKRWAVTFNKIASISVEAPYADEATLPWWPRITYGKFSQRQNGITYYFDIPEYKNQTWSKTHGYPFKDIGGEPVTFLNKLKIKVDRKPILSKKGNIAFFAGDGTKVYDDTVIKDIDTINGFIYLKDGIILPEDVFVDYTYLENTLIYKHININGHFTQNPYILDKYILFYALPIKSSSGINRTRGIFHSVGDSVNEAINNISEATTTEPIAILGALTTRPVLGKEDINVVDTRVYGGGLIEDTSIEASMNEAKYFYDIGTEAGIPYPGAASIAINLPDYLREVMTIEELKQRSKKFIAAGVYPVYDFDTELDKETIYAADISLLTKTPTVSAMTTGAWAGPSGTALGWINYDRTLPTGLYETYKASDILPGPVFSGDTMMAKPGTRYYQMYVRGSVDPIFRYEEKTPISDWTKRTFIDERDIASGTLVMGRLDIDATHAYTKIRNIEGSALFALSNASGYYDKVATDIAEYVKDINKLSITGNHSFMVEGIVDIFSTGTPSIITGDTSIPIDPEYAVLMDNYSGLANHLLLDDEAGVHGAIRLFHDKIGVSVGSSNWPRIFDSRVVTSDFPDSYYAFNDIYHGATYTRDKMNIHAKASGTSSITNDILSQTGQVASFKIAESAFALLNIGGANNVTGVYQPFRFNPAANTAVAVLSGNTASEINTTVSNTHSGLAYIKAAAALYATQDRPMTGELAGSPSSNSLDYNFSPRRIALTGIALATDYFNDFYKKPVKDGVTLPDTWITDFNRTSDWASNYLSTITNAFDNLYYGNVEWAGYSGAGADKLGTKAVGSDNNITFSGDTAWSEDMSWPDGTFASPEQYLFPLKNKIEANFNLIGEKIRSQAGRGGILPNGYIDAVKHFLWIPRHQTEGTHPFSGSITSVSSGLVDIFELGMDAIIKGSLSEDGILSEGGSFKHTPAPFPSTLPSSLLETCADAISYYNTVGNLFKRNKWTAMYQGIYNTTLELYEQAGGFPYNTNYSLTSATGDPGSALIGGLTKYIGYHQELYATGEMTLIISGASTRY